MADPRPAYAAADIMLGMGTSVVRGMAFSKPAIVVGEGGFSRALTAETLDGLVASGFYGVVADPDSDLAAQIEELVVDGERRGQLGRLGRELALRQFDVNVVADHLGGMYDEVVALGAHPSVSTWSIGLTQTVAKMGLQAKHAVGRRLRERS